MLKQIVDSRCEQVAAEKRANPLSKLEKSIVKGNFAFGKTIHGNNWSLIAECKLASPAKGRLCSTHTVPELAKIYSDNGAAALSVHTSSFFDGKLADIAAVRAVSTLPILRKDFIIDDYQLYEARAAGADAVLLIAAILTASELELFINTAHSLGMDCLVEVHSAKELAIVQTGPAEIIGINNRNLKTFKTDIATTFELLPLCEAGRAIISESGIATKEQAQQLRDAGLCGILVGEGLVRAADIALCTRQFALKSNV
jgi:indole-3-glycerol phosphate synthase